jgi:hypothetical protein
VLDRSAKLSFFGAIHLMAADGGALTGKTVKNRGSRYSSSSSRITGYLMIHASRFVKRVEGRYKRLANFSPTKETPFLPRVQHNSYHIIPATLLRIISHRWRIHRSERSLLKKKKRRIHHQCSEGTAARTSSSFSSSFL